MVSASGPQRELVPELEVGAWPVTLSRKLFPTYSIYSVMKT
jgi:hypothetical protein